MCFIFHLTLAPSSILTGIINPMLTYPGIHPVDYLLIGHITKDLTPTGPHVGGSVAYAGLTARALGQEVGIVTAWGEDVQTGAFDDLNIANQWCEQSTTFENVYTPEGRIQTLHAVAPSLDFYHIPESWRATPIVHLAPVAREIQPNLIRHFPEADIYLTLQGWLRNWGPDGRVFYEDWPEASYILQQVNAAVISEEDVHGDQETINHMAASAPVLAVTKGALGADIYAQGGLYKIPAPHVHELDATGAGDIFAAVFFTQMSHFHDPVSAAEMAVQIASDSITRQGLASAPDEEILYQLSKGVQ